MAYEAKKVSPVTVTAGMCAAVLSMFIGSRFGTSGTFLGAGIGSGVAAVGGTIFENVIRGAHYVARERSTPKMKRIARISVIGTAMAVITGMVALGTLTAVEAATGRTLYSITTGNPQYGNSFSYQTKPPKPSVSYSETVSPSPSISPSPSAASPSPSFTATPTVSPSSSATPSPSIVISFSPDPSSPATITPFTSPSGSVSPTP